MGANIWWGLPHIWGELLRLVPSMLVWHHQKNIFFLQDLAKLKLKTSNIYVTMKKKHSGQAPTLLVLIWDLSQFWPCHTNMLGFFKSLLSRNFCSEICWECHKNFVGYRWISGWRSIIFVDLESYIPLLMSH